MIRPTPDDIGLRVIYRSRGGKVEEGTISSMTTDYVFVRYTSGGTAAATRREDLEWSTPAPTERGRP